MSAHRFRRFTISLALVLGSIAIAILLVLAADRVLGRMLDDPRLTAGLIFPPQVEIIAKTYEYSYTIKTNNLGLRDDPYDPHKRPKILVAAIGDSFTFGQGVALEDAWVQRVERALRAKGLDVEILNLGQPGSSPPFYAQLAEESLSLLKPDLVLVDILQSNDFEQLDPNETYGKDAYRREPPLRAVLRGWFPNFTDLAYREHAQRLAEREHKSKSGWNLMRSRWKEEFPKAYAKFDSFDDAGRYTFLSLPDPIQQAFRDGGLSPLLALMCCESLRMKRQQWWELDVSAPEVQSRIKIVANSLERVSRAAAPWGGPTVVLALPQMDNVDPFGRGTLYRLFGIVEWPPLDDTRADDAIHQSADRAGLPCHDVTTAFREAARREPLFYPFDSHMTARGNEVYAELITPVIEQYVREIAARR